MSQKGDSIAIERLHTGIKGFDIIAEGGLPKGRTTLLAGTAGSSKTVFAVQFLIEGIRKADEGGVFVTFEESPQDIKRNMKGFGWDIEKYEKENKWAFVDASPDVSEEAMQAGSFDLGALLVRIEHAVKKINARRLSMDSLGAIFTIYTDKAVIRNELLRIGTALKEMNVTSLMTAERIDEYGDISKYGVEEFVTDNVIVLRNVLEDEKRRRTLEILKFRGVPHQRGEYPFTIVPEEGVVGIPLSGIELKQKSSDIRIPSGIKELDSMCGGGFFRDSIILVSGATGTGKTLTATQFMAGGFTQNENCLLFAFEESREQLVRNAIGWGIDYEKMEEQGLLKIICEYPEGKNIEDHLIMMKDLIEEYKPQRIAIDSLSALERISTIRGFREFVIGMTSFIKHKEVTGLFTSTTPALMGGSSITEAHISTITDSIILLRYVEINGEMHRGLTVLKMRGSQHEKEIREIKIDGKGMHIGDAFRNVSGILAGMPRQIPQSEIKRLEGMFDIEGNKRF